MRILLAVIAGYAVGWLTQILLTGLHIGLPGGHGALLNFVTGTTIAGYLARKRGWLAGCIIAVIDMARVAMAFASLGDWPEASTLFIVLAWMLLGGLFGGMGQKWYETAERWRRESKERH